MKIKMLTRACWHLHIIDSNSKIEVLVKLTVCVLLVSMLTLSLKPWNCLNFLTKEKFYSSNVEKKCVQKEKVEGEHKRKTSEENFKMLCRTLNYLALSAFCLVFYKLQKTQRKNFWTNTQHKFLIEKAHIKFFYLIFEHFWRTGCSA